VADEASAQSWAALDSWELFARPDESEADYTYFYLNETEKDLYHTYRVMVTTNARQNLGLRLDVLQLSWAARYEVVFGFILLVMVYSLIIFEWVHRTVAALIGSFWGLALLSAVIERPSLYEARAPPTDQNANISVQLSNRACVVCVVYRVVGANR
jgi:hypothetical protein